MSASREFSLTLELGPPSTVRPGSPFTLPVIVAVRPLGAPSRNTHLVVNVSLRDESSSTAVTGLSGNLTASVRSRGDSFMGGYAKFSPLTITRPGKYRLRVMLSSASVNGVFTKEIVDSGVIHVHAAGSAAQRPCGSLPPSLPCLLGFFFFFLPLAFNKPHGAPFPFPGPVSSSGGLRPEEGALGPPLYFIGLLADLGNLAPTQLVTLQRLVTENLDISATDIAAWQRA